MPNRMIRFTTFRNGHNPHGLRFVEGEPGPTGDGGQTDPPADPPSDPPTDPPNEPEGEPSGDDIAEQLAAAKRVNGDLERKLKRSDDNRAKVADLEQQIASLQGKEVEWKAAQEQQRIKDEALSAANDRIKKAELRAAAAGKVTNDLISTLPQIADLSSIEVGEDGEVDAEAMSSVVADLIQKYPSLAAQGDKRFTGSGDGGHRKETPKRAGSLSEAVANKLSSK